MENINHTETIRLFHQIIVDYEGIKSGIESIEKVAAADQNYAAGLKNRKISDIRNDYQQSREQCDKEYAEEKKKNQDLLYRESKGRKDEKKALEIERQKIEEQIRTVGKCFFKRAAKRKYEEIRDNLTQQINIIDGDITAIKLRNKKEQEQKETLYREKKEDLDKREAEELQKTENDFEKEFERVRLYHERQKNEKKDLYFEAFRKNTQILKKIQNHADSVIPDFEDYDMPGTMPDYIPLGTISGRLKKKYGIENEKILADMAEMDPHISCREDGEYVLSIPYCQSIGDGLSVLFRYSLDHKNQIMRLIQPFILYMLMYFPAKKVELTMIDALNAGSSFSDLNKIAGYGNEQIIDQDIWSAQSDIDAAIKRMLDFVVNINKNYGEKNLEKRLQEEPFKFLVITDFPHNFSEQTLANLMTIVRNAKKTGIGVFIFVSEEEIAKLNQTNGTVLHEIMNDLSNIVFDGQNFFLKYQGMEPVALQLKHVREVETNLDNIIKKIRYTIERTKNQDKRLGDLYKFDVLDSSNWFTGTDEMIEIPFGFAGADNIVKLHFGDRTFQHLMIAGSTQSGKSRLLHVIIVGILLMYSYESKMVQLQLIDFKEGVEFQSYMDYRLPVIEKITLNTDRAYALDMLRDLETEFKRRAGKFKEKRVSSINEYNRLIDEDTERMPRKIFIFDELEKLFELEDSISEECMRIFNTLFDQGGALGIQFILSTQNFDNCPGLNTRQFKGRISLAGGAGVFEEAVDMTGMGSGYLYFNQNYGKGSSDLIRYPHVNLTEDVVTKAFLAKLDEYYRMPGITDETETRVWTTNMEQIPNFVMNRMLRNRKDTESLDAENKEVQLLLGTNTESGEFQLTELCARAGENMLMVSEKQEPAENLFATICVSVLYETAIKCRGYRGEQLYVLDLFRRKSRESKSVLTDLSERISEKRMVYSGEVSGASQMVGMVYNRIKNREEGKEDTQTPVYFLFFGMQKLNILCSVGKDDLMEQVLYILRNGPAVHVHMIAWISSYKRTEEVFEGIAKFQNYFKHNIIYKVSKEDAFKMLFEVEDGVEEKEIALYNDWDLSWQNEFRLYERISGEWMGKFAEALEEI